MNTVRSGPEYEKYRLESDYQDKLHWKIWQIKDWPELVKIYEKGEPTIDQ